MVLCGRGEVRHPKSGEPLTGHVLADAIAQVTGVEERYPGYPTGTRAVQLIDPQTPSYTLDVLGRCQRETVCTTTPSGGGLAQTLHLLNGPAINEKLSQGDVNRLMLLVPTDRERIATTIPAAITC